MQSKIDQAIASSVSPQRLELIILPTEKCNFRCTYCYEDFEIGRMKPGVVNGVKALITERVKDLSSLKLTWFGGEPLLERDLIREIAGHAKRECESSACELLPGEITTNGYLLNGELFEELVDLEHRLYQISLDGDKEEHERTRRHIAGKPTFERIMGHLYEIRATRLDFKVMLRLHLKPDNRDSLLALASRLKQDFLGDSRFSVLLKSIGNWGGPNSGKFDTLAGDAVKQRTSELKSALFGERSVEHANDEQSMPYVCYASTPNSLLVRPDGRIGKCTTALSDPLNDVGKLSPNGTIQFNNESLRYWFQGLHSKNPSELACPYHFAQKPKIVAPVPVQIVRNVARAAF